jgi:hypothetical protein
MVNIISPTAAGLPFIVSTGSGKADPDMRKLIRSHVMLGKNLGKSPARRKGLARSDDCAGEVTIGVATRLPLAPVSLSIPPKVGSDVSLIKLADVVDPTMFADICHCMYQDSYCPGLTEQSRRL